MPLIASYSDGGFVTKTTSSESLSKAKETNSSGMDSDAFLQLLVAEMQNQDPLEPTSNTEWVSQYATFTQVSEIQSIGDDMNSIKAQDLVDEYVIMKVTSKDGNTDYVTGKVEYVAYEEGEAYLSINGSLYSIKDLDTVASQEYMDAYNLANTVAEKLQKLPSLDYITSSYKSDVDEIVGLTANMTDYQKSFLQQSVFDTIAAYKNKMDNLVKADSDSEDSEDSGKAEDVTDSDKVEDAGSDE